MQWVRSLVFIGQMYLVMAGMALAFLVPAMITRRGAYAGVRLYCGYVRWTARWMVGLDTEIRGEVPLDEVLIASKHQSFLDIILLCSVLPRPKFIMKKELKWAPIVGWYAMRIGCVPVDRGKRGAAIGRMLDEVRKGHALPGQLIIYPQGTRVAPGLKKPFKVGSAVLYAQLGQDCVPAATNVGLFWPRHGILRKPGLAVLEFLPRIPQGQGQAEFMATLEAEIESASDRLLAEGGFRPVEA